MDTAPATDPTPDTASAPDASTARFAAIKARVGARFDDLQHRAKELGARAQVLQARARELPLVARGRALALVERVRIALDLPSRSEIAELTARLDKLDARIAELSGSPIAAPAELTEGADVPEQSRKDKKRTQAAKSARR